MARNMESGQIEEIIVARFENGEDILEALFNICVEKDIKTGIILEGSGAVQQFVYQHFPKSPEMCAFGVEICTMEGPCEISLKGTIGTYVVADKDSPHYVPKSFPTIPGIMETDEEKWNCAGAMNGDGTPYIHAHCTATNKDYTVCGHLMRGTKVFVGGQSEGCPAHFTVIIAKLSGVVLENRVEKIGGYHLVKKV